MRVLAGRYELVRFVGRGGMGEVWEGRDRVIARRVAVKLLPHAPGDAAGAALFLREARTAGALHHPGVVTVHDLGRDEADGSLFLVMEFVEGRDLATVLREDGPPPVTVAVEWAGQVAAALSRAHAAGIVHRDLKPANLMLTTDGRVKVLDFGIARFVESTHRSSKVIGTLAYMPPERLDEHPGDARSDLYSLGCVLHELLTGTVPFEATSPVSMMNAHLRKTPERPGAHRPGVPARLDDLVLALLAKNPDDRPATADELHTRLHAIGTPDRATPASPIPADGRPPAATPAAPDPDPEPDPEPTPHEPHTDTDTALAQAPTRTRAPTPPPPTPTPAGEPVDGTPTAAPEPATATAQRDSDSDADGSASTAAFPGRRRFLWIAAGTAAAAGTGIAVALTHTGGGTAAHKTNPPTGPQAQPATSPPEAPVTATTSAPGVPAPPSTATSTSTVRPWRFTTGDAVLSSPAVVNGVVYIGSQDKNVYAIDATTGTKKWAYTAGSGVDPSPAVAGGLVYVGSDDKNVYALDAATGAGPAT
ncbi:protein kinase [Embleya sp. NPDC056575]|uniref:protein kinase domain-containing protein n=1 Tax=unclassified Embleya TaxID=2699296 RepID=UPI0036ADD387